MLALLFRNRLNASAKRIDQDQTVQSVQADLHGLL